MIYLFTGDDTTKKLAAYEKFVASFPASVETFVINKNEFDPVQLWSLYSGSGLNIFEFENARDFILGKLTSMQSSENSFVFLEGKLNKSLVDAFTKVGAKVNIFELPKAKKEKFNNFLLATAFEQKDKLNLWIYYRQAVDLGVGLEELTGVLFWKMKDMILKKNFRKFSEAELKTTASKLSYLLPEAREKGNDAEIVFERFLLGTF